MIRTQSLQKTFLLGFCTSIALFVMFVSSLVFAEQGGSNIVPVESCQQSGSGVTVERFGSIQTLSNGCRDAGHGERDYTLTCESETSYRSSWVPCASAQPEPEPQPEPQQGQSSSDEDSQSDADETAEPAADVTENPSSAGADEQSTQQPSAPAASNSSNQQQSSSSSSSSSSQSSQSTQDDGCGDHGYFHTTPELGDHCHCDNGYLEHPNELMCISALEFTALTTDTSATDTSNSGSQQSSSQQSSSNTNVIPPTVDDGCGPHGWLNGALCHCDNGYLEHPNDLICISTDEYRRVINPESSDSNASSQESSSNSSSTDQDDDGCGDNGYFHTTPELGDHCHCDNGYLEHPDELMCILADEYVLLFGSDAEIIDDSSATDTSAQQHQQAQQPTNTPQEASTDPCAPHGWQHGEHCHCDNGYIPSGLSCIPLAEFLASPDEIIEVTPETTHEPPVATPTHTESTNTVDPCAPNGWQHGDHCDCNAGYIGQGLSCVSLASLLNPQAATPDAPVAALPMIPSVADISFSIVDIEDDADGCGPGGWLHNDHCDCEPGFLPIDLMCVSLDSLLTTYKTHTGEPFTDASLIFDEYLAAYTEDIDAVILNWQVPEGPYDGFLLQAAIDDVSVAAKVLPKYRQSYRFTPEHSGLHTVSVVPYVLLEDGTPLLYETDADTLVYLQAEVSYEKEAAFLHNEAAGSGFVSSVLELSKRVLSAFFGS